MAVTLHASVLVDGRIAHASLSFDADGLATVGEVFEAADRGARMGPGFFKRLLGWRRRSGLTVLHNGQRLKLPEGLRTPVRDGDELTLLTPAMGG